VFQLSAGASCGAGGRWWLALTPWQPLNKKTAATAAKIGLLALLIVDSTFRPSWVLNSIEQRFWLEEAQDL